MECKESIGKILEIIKTELNEDNFVFSRIVQLDKDGNIIKRCILGHLVKKNGPFDLTLCYENIAKLFPEKLFNYLFIGYHLELNDTTKSKTLISKRPVLTEHSTYGEVLGAWQFVYDNYDKVMKAL